MIHQHLDHTDTDTSNKLKDVRIFNRIKITKVTEKHLCQSLIFNKVAGLRLETLLKKRFWPEAAVQRCS